ncbi:MAG: DUF3817 domain-containing protein [Actinomycetota bacterium]
MTVRRTFVAVAAIEATTLLVLVAAVISYRVFDGPDLTATVGPIHGVAFLAYFAVVVSMREHHDWSAGRTFAVLVAAVVPGGGYVVAHRLAASGAEGSDRTP